MNPLEDFEEGKEELEAERSVDFPEETVVRRQEMPGVTPGGPPRDSLLESSTFELSTIDRPNNLVPTDAFREKLAERLQEI